MKVSGGADDGEEDAEAAAALLAASLAGLERSQDTAVVYATGAAEYKCRGAVTHGASGEKRLAVAGCVAVRCRATVWGLAHTDLDDPQVPDGATRLEIELEQIELADTAQLSVFALLPDIPPERRFTSEGGVPFAPVLAVVATDWARWALAGPWRAARRVQP